MSSTGDIVALRTKTSFYFDDWDVIYIDGYDINDKLEEELEKVLFDSNEFGIGIEKALWFFNKFRTFVGKNQIKKNMLNKIIAYLEALPKTEIILISSNFYDTTYTAIYYIDGKFTDIHPLDIGDESIKYPLKNYVLENNKFYTFADWREQQIKNILE